MSDCHICKECEGQYAAELQARVKELEAQLELRNINAEQFGDLSNCYDVEDVNQLVTRVFTELKEENARLRAVVDAARDVEKIYWDFEKTMAPQVTVLKKALRELDGEYK